MSSTGTPMNLDQASHLAQTQGMQGLVDAAMANNNDMMATADSAMAANVGQLSAAFQGWCGEVHMTAVSVNTQLLTITEALGLTATNFGSQDEDAAATMTALNGALPSAHIT